MPPDAWVPGVINSRLAPSVRIFSETCACAPNPTETMQTTAATPTMIPRIVRMLRILLT
jgi:hypothetical protein